MVFIALPSNDDGTQLPFPPVYIPQFKPKGQWNLEATMRSYGAKPDKIRLPAGEQFFPETFV
jgi:hypothetical protein